RNRLGRDHINDRGVVTADRWPVTDNHNSTVRQITAARGHDEQVYSRTRLRGSIDEYLSPQSSPATPSYTINAPPNPEETSSLNEIVVLGVFCRSGKHCNLYPRPRIN